MKKLIELTALIVLQMLVMGEAKPDEAKVELIKKVSLEALREKIESDLNKAKQKNTLLEEVKGLETYEGELISSKQISKPGDKAKTAKKTVGEILKKRELILRSGQVLAVDDVEYLYIGIKGETFEEVARAAKEEFIQTSLQPTTPTEKAPADRAPAPTGKAPKD